MNLTSDGKSPLDAGNAPNAQDGMIRQAVRDARQLRNPALRQEALAWLWICCPDIADELALPLPAAPEMQDQLDAYCRRQAAI